VEILLGISLPFFGLIGAGYFAGRFGALPPPAATGLNSFVFWFALPAMLFMRMSSASLLESFDWRFVAAFSGGGLISFAVCVVAGRLLFQTRLAEAAIQGMAASFGNVGYLGLPLLLAAFGDSVIVPAVTVIVLDHILLLPLTTALIQLGSGRHASSAAIARTVALALARNPLIIATAAGIAWSASGATLPQPLATFGELLASAAAPCALFVLGATLVGRPLSSGFPELALMSACKLLLHPALVLLLATLLSLDPLLRAVAVVEAGLPIAANVFVMARGYNVYVERASSAILLTTIIAVFTVSALLAIFAR
jgi:malonate transporter